MKNHNLFRSVLGTLLLLFCCLMARAEVPPAPVDGPQIRVLERMSVETLGTGPDVFLLPGFASSCEIWRPLANRLAAKYRVHLVRYAGFAGEPRRAEPGEFIQPLADELQRYIREGKIEKPTLIGHSMGGMLAVLFAQQHPDSVGRVMSIDSLPMFPIWTGKKPEQDEVKAHAELIAGAMLAADDATFYTSQTAAAAKLTSGRELRFLLVDWALASDRMAFADALRDLIMLDLRPGMAAMVTPICLVYAADAKSGNAPQRATAIWKREYAALPGATFKMVNNSRHFIMVDQRQKLDGIIDEWLQP